MNVQETDSDFNMDVMNLMIIECLLRHPESSFKQVAELLDVDQRTVARRIRFLTQSGVLKQSFSVDWPKLGIGVAAYVGSTTARGERSVAKLREFAKADPRIVEAYETLGSHQYVLHVLANDLTQLRESVLRDLEPLTAELGTSIISSELKTPDYATFIRYIRETRHPRTRASQKSAPFDNE